MGAIPAIHGPKTRAKPIQPYAPNRAARKAQVPDRVTARIPLMLDPNQPEPTMTPITTLRRAAYGVHLADQIALVSVPLVAGLVFNAPATVIGALVACQSGAHLLGSIPFGILVDTAQLRTLALVSMLTSLIGFCAAMLGIMITNLLVFGGGVTLAGFGIVLFSLTTLSILPKSAAPKDLASANAGIELPRFLASFLVPLTVGLIAVSVPAAWFFALAALGALWAFAMLTALPKFPVEPEQNRQSIWRKITQGGAFVIRHPLLRAISLCAIFWNFAFSALLVSMVPFIATLPNANAGSFGIALAAFGLGGIGGTWTSRRYSADIAPNLILLFGPGSTALAALFLAQFAAIGGTPVIYGAFFVIGFGPSMWLIAQNSVRQIVTPSAMLGRVNAMIQTAIYGIRPLGALVAGGVIAATTVQTGLMMVTIAFALSFLAAALSGLRSVNWLNRLIQHE